MSPNQVNGLQLPPLLVELLSQGRWCHPGDESLERLIPFLREPVDFLPTIESMRNASAGLACLADDESIANVFHIGRGSEEIKAICLPWLDVELAVAVSTNRFPGDDLAIALDYRPGISNARVVASDWLPGPDRLIWREVAPTFLEFVRTLGVQLPNASVSLTHSRRTAGVPFTFQNVVASNAYSTPFFVGHF